MADNFFGKVIPLTSGFDLSAKSPLDSRLVVDTIEERDDHVKNNRAYIGMTVFVVAHLKEYVYIGNNTWIESLNADSDINIDFAPAYQYVDNAMILKADVEHGHDQYLEEIPVQFVEDTDWDNGEIDWEQIGYDLGAFATKNDILNHNHDEKYVLKDEMHEPPEFEFLINMVDLKAEPSVEVEGEYPNLLFTLNVPGFSGSYDDLSNKPTIPELVSQLENDLGFVTQEELEDFITGADLAQYVTYEALEQMDFATTNYVDQRINNHDHLVITENEIRDIVEEI